MVRQEIKKMVVMSMAIAGLYMRAQKKSFLDIRIVRKLS